MYKKSISNFKNAKIKLIYNSYITHKITKLYKRGCCRIPPGFDPAGQPATDISNVYQKPRTFE